MWMVKGAESFGMAVESKLWKTSPDFGNLLMMVKKPGSKSSFDSPGPRFDS